MKIAAQHLNDPFNPGRGVLLPTHYMQTGVPGSAEDQDASHQNQSFQADFNTLHMKATQIRNQLDQRPYQILLKHSRDGGQGRRGMQLLMDHKAGPFGPALEN